jgi:phosphatidylinositol N-acetylglucosaminyltransferase subunit H
MDQEKKLEVSNTSHTYKHHCSVGVDVHEIFVKRSRLRVVLSYIGIIFLLVNACQPLLTKVQFSCNCWRGK